MDTLSILSHDRLSRRRTRSTESFGAVSMQVLDLDGISARRTRSNANTKDLPFPGSAHLTQSGPCFSEHQSDSTPTSPPSPFDVTQSLSTSPSELSDFEEDGNKVSGTITSFLSTRSQIGYTIVDSTDAITGVMGILIAQATNRPCIFMNLEGQQLGRRGAISLLFIYVSPLNHVYVLDIATLSVAAFETRGNNGCNFREVLESESITKVFFDVRSSSDALHGLYNISLGGAQDIQLMELAARRTSKKFVRGLAKCIHDEGIFTPEREQDWLDLKNGFRELTNPACGGVDFILDERPLRQSIVCYCVHNVYPLALLYRSYRKKLNVRWLRRVELATADRVCLSQRPNYEGQGRHMALGPW